MSFSLSCMYPRFLENNRSLRSCHIHMCPSFLFIQCRDSLLSSICCIEIFLSCVSYQCCFTIIPKRSVLVHTYFLLFSWYHFRSFYRIYFSISRQRTELYEYSKVLENSQFILLPFQPYKFIYAYKLFYI